MNVLNKGTFLLLNYSFWFLVEPLWSDYKVECAFYFTSILIVLVIRVKLNKQNSINMKQIKKMALVILVSIAASVEAQTWGSSGTDATCTNGGATRIVVNDDGTVWIGDGSGTQKSTSTILFVDGKMRAREVIINMANWPDYVFDSSYQLPELSIVQDFIDSAHHLPNVPSATQVSQEGVELGDMNAILLRKLEEMQLYILQLNSRIKELEALNSKNN